MTKERAGPEIRATALIGMMLASALAPLGSTMIAVALPRIGGEIGADVATLTPWLVSSYLIAAIALQSPGGKLGDLLGHGRALLIGLGLVAAGSTLGVFANRPYTLGIARILMAAGGAATVPATMAILRNHTRADRRARVFGLFGACMSLAAAAGPLIGGELTERFGWRAVFVASLPVVAVSVFLVATSRGVFSRERIGPAPSFDWLGSALIASGLTLAIAAVGMTGTSAMWVGACGAALLFALPWWERHTSSPVVDFALFRRAEFFGGGAIVALQNMAMYPLLFQLPVFFDRVRGSGVRTTGYALLALTLAMTLCSMIAGRLSEIIGARAQALAGSIIALVGLWWFANMEGVHLPGQLIPGMIAMGAGVGLTSAPAQAAAMTAIGRHQSGMAGGMLSTMRYVGGVAGTGVLGALLVDPSSAASHQRPIAVYAGALLAAGALSLMLPGRAGVLTSASLEQADRSALQ